MTQSILKSRMDTIVFLGLNSLEALKTLQKDPLFPKPIKLGGTRQSPVFFDCQELIDWVDAKKAERPVTAPFYGSANIQKEVSA